MNSDTFEIETVGLTKVFNEKRKPTIAVDNINLRVSEGDFYGLLGPNGAGKTTIIKMLCTLILPSSGTAKINGYDVLREPERVRESIGWLHGETGGRALYWRLSASDNLAFYAHLHNVHPVAAKERIEALLDFFGLRNKAETLVKNFSTGMKFKLMLARCLLPNPPVLMLDEPTAGLDAATAIEIRELLRELNKQLGKTILFTSHNLYEVERLCHKLAILNNGKIIAEGSPQELGRIIQQKSTVEVKLKNCDLALAKKALLESETVKEITSIEARGESVSFVVEVDDSLRAIPDIASKLGYYALPVVGVNEIHPNLEEIFLKITERGNNGKTVSH